MHHRHGGGERVDVRAGEGGGARGLELRVPGFDRVAHLASLGDGGGILQREHLLVGPQEGGAGHDVGEEGEVGRPFGVVGLGAFLEEATREADAPGGVGHGLPAVRRVAVLVIADAHLEGQGEDGLALGDVATRLETASAAAAVGEADGQTAPRGAALHAPLDELAHHRALANLIVRLHVRAVGGSVGCGSVGGFRRRG